MSEIKVLNRAHLPIHGVLSWAGNQMQSFNDLPVGGEFKFSVGLGATDIFIVIGSEGSKFDPRNDGQINVGRLLLQGLALATVGLVGFSGLTMLAEQVESGLWRMDVKPGGAGEGGEITIQAAPGLKVFPVSETELYCPDGYDVTVTGGEITGKYDKVAKIFTVTEVKPLRLHWHNNTSGTTGDRVAAT